jgi:hypothetical protein
VRTCITDLKPLADVPSFWPSLSRYIRTRRVFWPSQDSTLANAYVLGKDPSKTCINQQSEPHICNTAKTTHCRNEIIRLSAAHHPKIQLTLPHNQFIASQGNSGFSWYKRFRTCQPPSKGRNQILNFWRPSDSIAESAQETQTQLWCQIHCYTCPWEARMSFSFKVFPNPITSVSPANYMKPLPILTNLINSSVMSTL